MKRKKNTDLVFKDTLTKYYKATYTNGDEEIFIAKDIVTAADYARNENSYGRTLESIKEYRELLDAMTDYQ
jgi:hypothetical protein